MGNDLNLYEIELSNGDTVYVVSVGMTGALNWARTRDTDDPGVDPLRVRSMGEVFVTDTAAKVAAKRKR